MIGFAGMSHLGLVSATAAAARGFDVTAFDADADLCRRLSAGDLPVHEPGLPKLLATHASKVRFVADAAALSGCSVIFVAIDVPTDADDRSDLGPVSALLEVVAGVAGPGAAIVVLSQVNPGYTRLARASVEANGARLYYQVETLIFGRAVAQAVDPERFMVGCADPANGLTAAYQAFLDAFGCPVLSMRYESAELCKLSINMFLVSQVSTTNMLAEICERIGAEWREIAPALRLDRRIGRHAYLGAGLGIGGGNLQRDMATIAGLARTYGTDANLIPDWASNSRYRRDWVLRALHAEVLCRVSAPAIGVWGLAYKEDTQSTRNSPAVHLLETLHAFDIVAYDPAAVVAAGALDHVRRVGSALDACADCDVLVVMTPWSEFRQVLPVDIRAAMRGTTVIDPFGVIEADAARQSGLRCLRLGTGMLARC
jgi:UDPglucose 6-dehydrogenase